MRPSPRVILWLAVAALGISLLPPPPRADETVRTVVRTYDPSGFRSETGDDGTRVVWTPGGRPAPVDGLPLDPVTVEAPEGMRLVEVRARAAGEHRLNLPLPAEAPGPAGDRSPGTVRVTEANPDRPRVDFVSSGWFRGRRMETVAVRPVVEDPSGEALVAAGRVELQLVFGPDETPAGEHLHPRPVAWEAGDRFAEAAAALDAGSGSPFFTGSARRGPAPAVNGSEPFSPRFRPSEDGSPVRFLIITTDEMAPAFQDLADWKTAVGMPTVVRSTSWIYANYPSGVDHAEEMREFIREAVEKWGVEYVLLGGDLGAVPVRYGKSYFYGGDLIPTDLYFMCLDGSWNGNGDDLFGQAYVNSSIKGDGADLYPDVWLGRYPVRSLGEAEHVVAKVLAYERKAPLGPGFGDQGLVLGEVLFPQNWSQGDSVIFDGAGVCETAVGTMTSHLSPYRMYENFTVYPGSVLEYKPDVISRLNAGYNMILHVGHGYRNTMAVGYGGEALSNGDADALYNGSRQGLLYAINCTSSSFDFDCIADHFLRNAYGGMVASVGSTRLDFPETGRDYQAEFFHQVYDLGATRCGEAAALQKIPFISSSSKDGEDRWTQFSLIYMGDPTLDLHTGAVGTLSVALDRPLDLEASSYLATVTDDGGPVEGATVCLNKAGDAYAYAVTDAAGQAVLPFRPDFPGKVSLGARAHNHRSRVDTLEVAPPAGAHLFVQDVVVDDAAGGDGDGALEAGETAFLYPRVGNQGSTASGPVSVTVNAAPAELTVIDGSASGPGALPDSSSLCVDPLQVSVDPGVADLSLLSLDLHLDDGSTQRDLPLVLYVGSPRISIQYAVRRDTTGNGNGDGVLDAGEDQHLRIWLRNDGVGRAQGLAATLSSTDPAVTVLDPASSYGDLEAGGTAEGDGFLFRFSDTDPTHPMLLTVSDQQGTVMEQAVDVSAPARPLGLAATGGAQDIVLRWFANIDTDLRGYDVYRSTAPSGPFTRVNAVPLNRHSYFRDEDLPSLTRFYYQVAAVDSSGNRSSLSSSAQATTSLPLHPGFPLELAAATSSSPCLAYLSGDTRAEIVTGADEIYITKDDGTELLDGDHDTRTYGVFTNSGFGPFWTPPAVGDLDGDGVEEIAAAGWSSGYLYVWDSHGNVRPGWPRQLNLDGSSYPAIWSAPVFADLDGDGRMEILISALRYTFAFHDDGTELTDGDNDPGTYGVLIRMGSFANYGTPAVADIDNTGPPEVIVGSRDGKLYVVEPDGSAYPGFPFSSGGEITNSPAVGDLDNDGLKEIVFGNSVYQVFALNKDLQQPPGWPVAANMNRDYDASPALADMDGDGYLDVIVCAGNGTPYMWHGQNGALFPGWGFVIKDKNGLKVALSSSPAVGNLDGDADLEVCFGAGDGNVYAFNRDASLVDGFPIGTDNTIDGGPLLWDIDNDGFTDVVVHGYDQHLYVWTSPGAFDPANTPWPMFHHDSRRTGNVDASPWVVTGVPGEGMEPRGLALSPNVPNPFDRATRISYRVPAGTGTSAPVSLSVYDLAGRRVKDLVDGIQASGEHTAEWDGTDAGGRRVGAGVYFYRLRTGGRSLTRKLVLLP